MVTDHDLDRIRQAWRRFKLADDAANNPNAYLQKVREWARDELEQVLKECHEQAKQEGQG